MTESCFGLGFMLGRSFGAANPPDAFGHAGAGGSLAFADPDTGISFAYVMNDLRFDARGRPPQRGAGAGRLPRVGRRELIEGERAVDARLLGQAEDAFADDVALDLVGSAPDRDRRCGEEQRLPLAVRVDGGVGAEDARGRARCTP